MANNKLINETIEKMQILGTYKPEFDDQIARYADMVKKYLKMSKKVQKTDDILTESAAGTIKMSPVAKVVTDLRRDIMAMEDRLLLTPREYYKIFQTEPDEEDDSLKDILEKIKD